MKRFFILAFLLLSVAARGAVIFPINDTSGFIGQFPTNYNQSISNLNAAIAAGGVAQSPFTNDLDAAGNSIDNLDAPEITNTTVFIRLWGTNVLSLQGTTNVALNGVSLMDGPSDGNTPQGPWTNAVSFNGFAGSGGNFIQLTNQTAIRVGTNLLAVQGWPDATNIAWNGAALINVSSGGGSQTPATNNIAYAGFTFSNASQGEVVQIPTTNHQQAAGVVSLFDDRNRHNRGVAVAGSGPTIPSLSLRVDATNNMSWIGMTIRQSNDVPVLTLSGISGPSSSYNPGFVLSTAARGLVYTGTDGTFRSSPGKTAGDEDLAFVMFRGVDEADLAVYAILGTAADTTSAACKKMLYVHYSEDTTGYFSWNTAQQDFNFTISGQTSNRLFRADASSDAIIIRQSGTVSGDTNSTNGPDAAVIVNGAVHVQGSGGNLRLANAGQATMTSGVCIVTMPVVMPDATYTVHPTFLNGGAVAGLGAFNLTNRTTTTFQLETVGTYSGLVLFDVIDY